MERNLISMQILVNTVNPMDPLHIVVFVTQNVLDVLVRTDTNVNCACIAII